MKRFKQIDLWINVVLLFILTSLVLTQQLFLFTAYFIIGGWQIISMIIHALNGWFMKKGGSRKAYHWAVIGMLVIVLISQLLYPFLFIFFFLLIGSPVLAVIYTIICYEELDELKNRGRLSLN